MKRFPSALKRLSLKEHKEYWYVLFIPIYLACYFLVEYLAPSDAPYWATELPLDDWIPFVEIFVIPYCLWYPMLLFTGLALMFFDVSQFRKYMRFLIYGFGVSLLICLLIPNGQNLRPSVFPRDNFCCRILARIYAADTNTNVFPSMHVVGCGAALFGVWHTDCALRRLRGPTLALCLLICVSTVLIKQHTVLDVVAGLIVCIPIWYMLSRKKTPAP